MERLDACHQFAEICVQAEEKLRSLIKERTFRTTRSHKDLKPPTEAAPKNEKAGQEVKKTAPKPDYCCPLCVEGNMTQDVDSEPDLQFDGAKQKREVVRAFRRKARHLRYTQLLSTRVKSEQEDSGSEDDDEESTDSSDGEDQLDDDGPRGSSQAECILPDLNSSAGVYATFVASTDEMWNAGDDADDK